MNRRAIVSTAGAVGVVALTAALVVGQTPATFSPLDMRVPVAPRPLIASGQTHLAYEIHITNMAPRQASLESVEVIDASPGASSNVLLRLQEEGLNAALRRFGASPDERDQRVLGAGQTAVLFVWLSVDSNDVPGLLTHRLAFGLSAAPGSDARSITVDGLDVRVASETPPLLGPPLEGDRWLAANGPDNGTGHRRTLLSLTGEARIAQRFATDWVRVHDNGRTFEGDPLKNESYRAFGADVLAVADGIVVDVLDDIPENVPDLVARAVPMTPGTLVGNYVLLDIGGGAWAVYSHLQLGSLQVRKGDTVRKGQVLGRVGNTGNSTEPHLHFHVADRDRTIDSEGIPYGFTSFELEAEPAEVTRALRPAGQSLEIDVENLSAWRARAPQIRVNEIPLQNALVAFARR